MKDSFGAVFDESGAYRYRLWRRWNPGLPTLCFIMLNPSTADCTENDPTIARCLHMAARAGYGAIEVVNLYAFKSTKPRDLWQSADPVGVQNDAQIKLALAHSTACVLAWGNLPPGRLERARQVLKIASGKKLFCLGLTKQYQPRHPLYLSSELEFEDFCPESTKNWLAFPAAKNPLAPTACDS